MSKQSEMEDIWNGWEYRIAEKLRELDHIARQMIKEMRVFSIPKRLYEPYVVAKTKEVYATIEERRLKGCE